MKDLVQSVDRALSIIEVLAEEEGGLGLSEISGQIDLHKSTVHRLLGTLIYKGYVEQDSSTNKYKLTMKLFELGNKKVEKLDVLAIAKPYLRELAKKTNEVVHLVIREEAEIIYIDKVEGDNTIRMHSSIGRRSPLYCTAVGKAMLAYFSDKQVEKLWHQSDITKYTEYTITDLNEMRKELEVVRKKGYAMDEQENELGVRCIGASIFDHHGKVCAAISISGPSIRMTEERIKEFAEYIKSYSRDISRQLGYRVE